ncbi:MAG: hypothetical protein EON58_21465 [Alphaproteobacteria bacterium]|nr:MAG: hypothetical protein EON58_21465 [Alphaproteobacteria bacterium]
MLKTTAAALAALTLSFGGGAKAATYVYDVPAELSSLDFFNYVLPVGAGSYQLDFTSTRDFTFLSIGLAAVVDIHAHADTGPLGWNHQYYMDAIKSSEQWANGFSIRFYIPQDRSRHYSRGIGYFDPDLGFVDLGYTETHTYTPVLWTTMDFAQDDAPYQISMKACELPKLSSSILFPNRILSPPFVLMLN